MADLDQVKATLDSMQEDAFDALPWCETYLYQGIRHLQRNCDIGCSVHEPYNGPSRAEECHQPGRHSGTDMARLINAVPSLIEDLEQARATNQRLNLRAQKAESMVASLHRIVGRWDVTEERAYISLADVARMMELFGMTPPKAWEIHYDRVKALEAEVERLRGQAAAALKATKEKTDG